MRWRGRSVSAEPSSGPAKSRREYAMPKGLWVVGVWSLLGVGCSKDARLAPLLPPCTASGDSIRLGVAAYGTVDPGPISGCMVFPDNPTGSAIAYLLVPQAVNGVPDDASAFLLRGDTVVAAAAPALAASVIAPRPGAQQQFDLTLRRAERDLVQRLGPPPRPPLAPRVTAAVAPINAGDRRVFKVCGNLVCNKHPTVVAFAKTVGVHIAVFVDSVARAHGDTLTTISVDSLADVFDTLLYATDTAAFGRESDIDNNGVVIVLMTGKVNSLVSSTGCADSGYVGGYFYGGDLLPGFSGGNNAEIFYSIVPDTTTYCYFLFGDLVNSGSYLARPDSFSLVDTAGIGGLENRGAYWLFVRFLVDQFAPTLGAPDSVTRRLDDTTFSGAANVGNASGTPFETIVEHWALANYVSDLPGFTPPPELQYTSWHFRTDYPALHKACLNRGVTAKVPIAFPLVPMSSDGSAVNLVGTMRGGSGTYQLAQQAAGAAGFTLLFGDPSGRARRGGSRAGGGCGRDLRESRRARHGPSHRGRRLVRAVSWGYDLRSRGPGGAAWALRLGRGRAVARDCVLRLGGPARRVVARLSGRGGRRGRIGQVCAPDGRRRPGRCLGGRRRAGDRRVRHHGAGCERAEHRGGRGSAAPHAGRLHAELCRSTGGASIADDRRGPVAGRRTGVRRPGRRGRRRDPRARPHRPGGLRGSFGDDRRVALQLRRHRGAWPAPPRLCVPGV